MCFFGQEKYIASISCLKRAMYLDPFAWIIAYNFRIGSSKHRAICQRISLFSSSINLVRATGAPDFASAYMYLGVTRSVSNDFENACQAYEKALEIDRDDHLCHLNYAVSLLNAGQKESAEKHLTHFERIFPDLDEDEKNNDPDVLEVRTELLNRLKN